MILFGLLKMTQAANNQCVGVAGLTLFDFAILDAAACFEQGVRLKDLERLGKSKLAIEAAAEHLEERLLVERTRAARDRRAFALVATKWGTAMAASTATVLGERWGTMASRGGPDALKAIQRLAAILLQSGNAEGDLLHRFTETLLLFESRLTACLDNHEIIAPQACILLCLLDARKGMPLSRLEDEAFCDNLALMRSILSLQTRNLIAMQDDTGQTQSHSTIKLTREGESLSEELKEGIDRILGLGSETQSEAASSLALLLDEAGILA